MEGGAQVLLHQLPLSNSELLDISGQVHIDMPNKNDGTFLKVPVLLQVSEGIQKLTDSKDFDDAGDAAYSRLDNSFADESSLSATDVDQVNLEDFVDIVTTYKCKFCRFSCAWKSGLISHIRNTHIAKRGTSRDCDASSNTVYPSSSLLAKTQLYTSQPLVETCPAVHLSEIKENPLISLMAPNLQASFQSPDPCHPKTEQQELQPKNGVSFQENFVGPSVQEKQIFLCGTCHQGFDTLEICKAHIVKDHQQISEVNESPKRKKRGKPKKRRSIYETENDAREKIKKHRQEFENEDYIETLSKRKVRPPRALSADYYLLTRKRKYTRRQAAQDKSFRCEMKGCNQHFLSEENLNYHMKCHKDDENVFQCLECFERCEHWRDMTIHLWKCHQIDLDLYACEDCDYHTYSLFKLENHRRIHSDERAFTCNICRKGFKQMSQLRNHQVIHVDRKNMIERRWFSEQNCDICNRTFSDSKCLRKHMQAVHSKLKPFVCTFCGHTSARKAMLQLHLRQHTGEKPFKCDLCEYQTGDHNSLRRHKMRHSGIKPYKCPHCAYACIQAISYKTHMKNKHPGMDGLFCCNLCSFRSVSRENYENHMSDHQRGAIPVKNVTLTNPVPTLPMQPEARLQDVNPTIPSTIIPSIAQLESALPGNLATAQLIYNCLNALSSAGNSSLPTGTTTSSTQDGSQTITVQVPCVQSSVEGDRIYLTIEAAAAGSNYTLETSTNEGTNLALELDQAEVISDGLHKDLIANDIVYTTEDNLPMNICVSDISGLPLLRMGSN